MIKAGYIGGSQHTWNRKLDNLTLIRTSGLRHCGPPGTMGTDNNYRNAWNWSMSTVPAWEKRYLPLGILVGLFLRLTSVRISWGVISADIASQRAAIQSTRPTRASVRVTVPGRRRRCFLL